METTLDLPALVPRPVNDMNEAQRAFMTVYVYKLFHDRGQLEKYAPHAPEFVDAEMDMEACLNGLWNISGAMWGNYSEEEQVETLYFSHPDIMEYYRLCRVYGKRFKVKLRDNPYMKRAADYVRRKLDQGCYSCDYRLQTKLNHKWASGIVFRMWPEFYYHFELLVLIARIFDFYTSELQKLKAELDESVTAGSADAEKEAA